MRAIDRPSIPGILTLALAVVALGPALVAQAPNTNRAGAAGGTTTIDLRGSALEPASSGVATVKREQGYTQVHLDLNRIPPPDTFGQQFVTYVVWAVTPVGDAVQLGVVTQTDDHGTLDTTTELESFALLVTAEPNADVPQPSDAVVMVSLFNDKPKQTISEAPPDVSFSPDVPLEIQQAHSALELARKAGAETYAPNPYQQAVKSLQQAEVYLSDPDKRDAAITLASEAAQAADDARLIAVSSESEAQYEAEREQVERELQKIQNEIAEAQNTGQAPELPPNPDTEQTQQDVARARNEEQRAQVGVDLEADRLAAEQEKALKDLETAQANVAALERAAALEQPAVPVAKDPATVRAQLQRELDSGLEAQQTEDAMIVSLPDDSFYVNAASLKQETRDMLGRIANVLLAYPSLQLDVRPEGSASSERANSFSDLRRENLLKRRARTIAAFLVSLGLDQNRVNASGIAASSSGSEDHSVELVITGDAIASVPAA